MNIQDGKILANYYGVCWHEVKPTSKGHSSTIFGENPVCKHCGCWMDWLNTPAKSNQPNFTTPNGWQLIADKIKEHGEWTRFYGWLVCRNGNEAIGIADNWLYGADFHELKPSEKVALVAEWLRSKP